MGVSRINMIKSELAIRKDRLIGKNKDILQAIAPYAMMGLMFLSMIGITYIFVSGLIEINEVQADKYPDRLDVNVAKPVVDDNLGVQTNKVTFVDTKSPLIDGGG